MLRDDDPAEGYPFEEKISESMDEEQTGLKALLRASSPKSFHDSSARHPPPRCHPGTRPLQRAHLARWAASGANQLLWLKGPPGVGKSAIAQTVAEELGDKLGATYFFSRPNHTDDPYKLFPTIAYQLALTDTSFGHALDRRIRHDPTIIAKPLFRQFEEIIVHPFRELAGSHNPLVVIVDGLDECRAPGDQIEIVKIIASSIRDATTPLLWALASRPEQHLIDVFSSSTIAPLCLYMDVPTSHEARADIERFLIDKLHIIKQHYAPSVSPWPPQEAISSLVDLSYGHFIFASVAISFIEQHPSDGPEKLFRAVLDLKQNPDLSYSNSIFTPLDCLYTLILERLSRNELLTALELLLATTLPRIGNSAHSIANLLHLSESQFRESLQSLRSVVTIVPTFTGPEVFFHHPSFLEFLEDPQRSQEFCLQPACVLTLRGKLLQQLEDLQNLRNPTHASVDSFLITWRRGGRNYYDQYRAHENCVTAFFHLCQLAPLDDPVIASLTRFDYSTLGLFWNHIVVRTDIENFLQSIPVKFQNSIVRHYTKSFTSRFDEMYKPPAANEDFSYILGSGSRKAFCWGNEGSDYFWIVPCPKYRLLDYVKRHAIRQIERITPLPHYKE